MKAVQFLLEQHLKKPAIPWGKRIADAKKRGRFTQRDIAASSTWVTCACGQQDLRIPRHTFDYWGKPKDRILAALGMDFEQSVSTHKPRLAEEILAQINVRSVMILKKLVVGRES